MFANAMVDSCRALIIKCITMNVFSLKYSLLVLVYISYIKLELTRDRLRSLVHLFVRPFVRSPSIRSFVRSCRRTGVRGRFFRGRQI